MTNKEMMEVIDTHALELGLNNFSILHVYRNDRPFNERRFKLFFHIDIEEGGQATTYVRHKGLDFSFPIGKITKDLDGQVEWNPYYWGHIGKRVAHNYDMSSVCPIFYGKGIGECYKIIKNEFKLKKLTEFLVD